ncbi:hypothetical protein [Bacillus sp. M6-12]|uniref:hypothetical protein n=1 Tax=Bacillus sp. M6-12 TaxID=2054166 RepID=UPI0015E12E1E|nr:hypothetical protein [Bacillus sp. M6-12]
MKANYECVNLDCKYTTNREDNLKIKDLNEVVKEEGGSISPIGNVCPTCHQNSLVLVLE